MDKVTPVYFHACFTCGCVWATGATATECVVCGSQDLLPSSLIPEVVPGKLLELARFLYRRSLRHD